ncbi:MAG TPA: ATP synthase F1 subunit epsilon [Candidatus Paceibacterota bacterium]|nr:ATP synthase F1 subunit epsilon [Candidatus Paceibacterota bacterium]
MLVNILSLNKILYQGEAESLTVPGAKGTLTVLPHHAPLITFLEKGKLKLKKEKELFFEIEKGILEVTPSEVNVLVSITEHSY